MRSSHPLRTTPLPPRCASAAGLLVFALLAAGGARAAEASLAWQREPWGQGERGAVAVAATPGGAWVAVGDASGATLVRDGRVARRIARAGVRDLAFDARGALWIATDEGLWRTRPDDPGAVEDRSPAPGADARRVARLAVDGEWIAAATDAGAFVALAGGPWSELDGAAPRAASSGVALRCRAGACDVAWIAGDALWRADLEARAGRPLAQRVRELAVAGAPAGAAPVDVAVAAGRLVVVYERALAIERADAPDAFALRRPALPPGAGARRALRALGRDWIATDRGLLHGSFEAGGAWRRADVPAGWLGTAAVASDGEALWVATASGVLRGRVSAPLAALADEGAGEAASARAVAARGDGAPPHEARAAQVDASIAAELRALHRMALAHQGLDLDRQRAWRARIARRAWWPEVDVRADYGGDRGRAVDFDQTFTSGATQHLVDRARDRGDDWDVGIALHWDLANAVLDGDAVDFAREERLWISLRDDVLDEIDQLYFERRRALLELAAVPDARSIDAERLRLRAAELAAGLDAWTGGGFSRALFEPVARTGDRAARSDAAAARDGDPARGARDPRAGAAEAP